MRLSWLALLLLVGCREQAITMIYQPMQCEEVPWQQWYNKEALGVVNVTQTDVIVVYYERFGIDLHRVRIETHEVITCEACGVCKAPYKAVAEVDHTDVDVMQGLGWQVA